MRIPAFSHPSLGPMPSDGTLCGSLPLTGATGAKQPPPAREDKAENRRVCLDYLKGRCVRRRCRFPHPDLSDYRQLSGAVQAQAGRQVCEVWAMTGQCKFGGKCSKLHPYVISEATPPAPAAPRPLSAPLRSLSSSTSDDAGRCWAMLGDAGRLAAAPREPWPADPVVKSGRCPPAHVFPFSLRTPPARPRDPTEDQDRPATPPPESATPAPPALAALEADLSKARTALRGCALPTPPAPAASAQLFAPHPLLDLLRSLNVAAC